MKIIEEDIVEATWREIGSLNEKQARQGMAKLGNRQTDLLTFVTTSMDALNAEAAELGIYVFYVVYRMFEKSSDVKLKRISANKIMSALEKNDEMLLRLDGAHDRFFERIAKIEASKQPNVMRYVLEVIMEAGDGPDPVFLSDEDVGSMYLTLKTAIDVLDEVPSKSRGV